MSVIEIRHLTCDYGKGRGIFDLTMDVGAGEIFGFLGPNGSGKTTTIRHLMGFCRAQEGTCQIEGRDCFSAASHVQETLGYLPGEISMFPELSGRQFLRLMAKFRGMKSMARAKELSQLFELDEKVKIKRMSKGNRQKLALVCAFMHDPKIYILDEPTASLDPIMQNRFVDLLLEERKAGKTILMTSHHFNEVEKACDHVGILKQGRLVTQSSVEELRRTERHVFLIGMENEEAVDAFCKEGVQILGRNGRLVQVAAYRDLRTLFNVLSCYPVTRFETVIQSLEEIFLHFYGDEEGTKS